MNFTYCCPIGVALLEKGHIYGLGMRGSYNYPYIWDMVYGVSWSQVPRCVRTVAIWGMIGTHGSRSVGHLGMLLWYLCCGFDHNTDRYGSINCLSLWCL